MKTPFSQNNKDFSDKAHKLAVETVYPIIFKTDKLDFSPQFTEEQNNFLDYEMGIDRIVKVVAKNPELKGRIPFTVQERFRRVNNIPANLLPPDKIDITITEWNNASGLPSEMYKLMCDFFLYGIYDEDNNKFYDIVAFNIFRLKGGILNNNIRFGIGYNPRSSQTFLTIKIIDMDKARLVFFWQNRPTGGGII